MAVSNRNEYEWSMIQYKCLLNLPWHTDITDHARSTHKLLNYYVTPFTNKCFTCLYTTGWSAAVSHVVGEILYCVVGKILLAPFGHFKFVKVLWIHLFVCFEMPMSHLWYWHPASWVYANHPWHSHGPPRCMW